MSNNNSDNDEYNSAENSGPSTPPELVVHLPPAPVTNPFAPPVFGAPAALSPRSDISSPNSSQEYWLPGASASTSSTPQASSSRQLRSSTQPLAYPTGLPPSSRNYTRTP